MEVHCGHPIEYHRRNSRLDNERRLWPPQLVPLWQVRGVARVLQFTMYRMVSADAPARLLSELAVAFHSRLKPQRVHVIAQENEGQTF